MRCVFLEKQVRHEGVPATVKEIISTELILIKVKDGTKLVNIAELDEINPIDN